MKTGNKVILIAGPAGSGKTTTALRIAKTPNWRAISEDELWVEMKKGHPIGEMRTEAEEAIIQRKTVANILAILEEGNNVVLEFILYRNPPTPLLFYKNELEKNGVDVAIRLLKPRPEVIWNRKVTRGRSWDQNQAEQSEFARHQLSCLESEFIQKDWIVDNSVEGIDEVFERFFKGIV